MPVQTRAQTLNLLQKKVEEIDKLLQALKDVSIDIKKGEAVWFGCDVGKYLHRSHGVMDTELFDFELFYGTDFTLNIRHTIMGNPIYSYESTEFLNG